MTEKEATREVLLEIAKTTEFFALPGHEDAEDAKYLIESRLREKFTARISGIADYHSLSAEVEGGVWSNYKFEDFAYCRAVRILFPPMADEVEAIYSEAFYANLPSIIECAKCGDYYREDETSCPHCAQRIFEATHQPEF